MDWGLSPGGGFPGIPQEIKNTVQVCSHCLFRRMCVFHGNGLQDAAMILDESSPDFFTDLPEEVIDRLTV